LEALLLFSGFLKFLHIYVKLTLHQATKSLNLGLEEVSLCLCIFKFKRILQQTALYEFVLNNLHLSDQVGAARPARHSFVNLFVFVDNPELFLEILFVSGAVELLDVSAVVELLVVDEDLCLGESGV